MNLHAQNPHIMAKVRIMGTAHIPRKGAQVLPKPVWLKPAPRGPLPSEPHLAECWVLLTPPPVVLAAWPLAASLPVCHVVCFSPSVILDRQLLNVNF